MLYHALTVVYDGTLATRSRRKALSSSLGPRKTLEQ